MKTRDLKYRYKLANRIGFGINILLIIVAFWILDGIDITVSPEFSEWYTNAFFLVKLVMLSLYFALAFAFWHLITTIIRYIVYKVMKLK